MIRYLGKFIVKNFIHDSTHGNIGMILESSNEKELHIGWFKGTKQVINLNPSTRKEEKQLKRIKKYKALQIEDFNLHVGLPTRILKILRMDGCISINLESILVPKLELDDVGLVKQLIELLQITGPVRSDTQSRKAGDTLRIWIQFWI